MGKFYTRTIVAVHQKGYWLPNKVNVSCNFLYKKTGFKYTCL